MIQMPDTTCRRHRKWHKGWSIFFSSAVNETEAIEEADWVADYISKYQITYPVAFDCEGFTDSASRQYGMSSEARTKVAEAFCRKYIKRIYTYVLRCNE